MNVQRWPLLLIGLIVTVFALVCTQQALGQEGPYREIIGTLAVSGPSVFINDLPAQGDSPVYSGDQVSTGPGSGAIVAFEGGGFFQIDQNTDPIFSWKTLVQLRCIAVELFSGQGFGDGQICIETPVLSAQAASKINIRVTRYQAVLTLLQGHLLLVRPQRIALAPGQEVTANTGSSVVTVRNLSGAELQQRVAWRSYNPTPPRPTGCPAGSVYDPRRRSCVPAYAAPRPIGCPAGSVYDPQRRSCVPAYAPPRPIGCPAGSVYDPQRRSCVPARAGGFGTGPTNAPR